MVQHSLVKESYLIALCNQTEDMAPSEVLEDGKSKSGVHSLQILLVDQKLIGIELSEHETI
jgi:hypothetical protein